MNTRRRLILSAIGLVGASLLGWTTFHNSRGSSNEGEGASRHSKSESPDPHTSPDVSSKSSSQAHAKRAPILGERTPVSHTVSAEFDASIGRVVKSKSGEIIVGIKTRAAEREIRSLAQSRGFEVLTGHGTNVYKLRGPENVVQATMGELREREEVEFVEANYLVTPASVPAASVAQPSPTALVQAVALKEAWKHGRGKGVIVAVVDSGLAVSTEGYADNVVDGYDIVDGDNVPEDKNGHGTACAGIIAGAVWRGSSSPVSGVAPEAKLMPVRVLDENAVGSYADVADGIDWAVEHGATIVLTALGGYGRSRYLENAVSRAVARGALVVASSGNDGGTTPVYPASIPSVLGVGALDGGGNIAEFSNTGDGADIFAPGVSVSTVGLDGQKRGFGGTSASAAVVAGVAALTQGRFGGLSALELQSRLHKTSDHFRDPESDPARVFGRINASRALAVQRDDVAVAALDLSAVSVNVGVPIKASILVENRGTTMKPATIVWRVDGRESKRVSLGPIAPNQTRTVAIEHSSNRADMQILTAALADRDDVLDNDEITRNAFVRPEGNVRASVAVNGLSVAVKDADSDGNPPIAVAVSNEGDLEARNLTVHCSHTALELNGIGFWEKVGRKLDIGSAPIALGPHERVEVKIPWPEFGLVEGPRKINCSVVSSDDAGLTASRSTQVTISNLGEVAGLHLGGAHKHILAQAVEYLKLKRSHIQSGVLFDLVDGAELATLKQASDTEDTDDENRIDINTTYTPEDIYWKGEKTATESTAGTTVAAGCVLGFLVAGPMGCVVVAIPSAAVSGEVEDYADGQLQTLDHFWDPDVDPTGQMVLDYIDDLAGYDPGSARSADEKARIHLRNAVFWYRAWQKYRWDLDKRKLAYTYLGRVAHLLADMSVPAHALTDFHISPDSYDNDYIGGGHFNDFWVDASWLQTRPGIVEIDSDAWKTRGFELSTAIDYLMFSNAQFSQMFSSNDVRCKPEVSWRSGFEFFQTYMATVRGNYNFCDTTGAAEAQQLMPLAIKSTASLFELLERDAIAPYDSDLDNIPNTTDNCRYFNPNQQPLCPAIWGAADQVLN